MGPQWLWNENTEHTDLKEGTGDPWAGQERLKGSVAAFSRVELLDSPENFGADPPTGSARELLI